MTQQLFCQDLARAIKTLKVIYRTRFADEKMKKLIRQNKGGTFHLCTAGHEMVGAVAASALIPGKDWGLAYYRDRGFAIGIGCTLTEIIAASLARDIPHHSSGRMMPEHFSHKALRLPCQSSCVGSQFLQAVGVAKARQLLQEDDVIYVSAGDGATSQGDFHEALNFSLLHKLAVIFVIQDNGFAISVPVKDQTAGGSITYIAEGYPGLSVFDVDGGDYEELIKAFDTAVQKARSAQGPSLIVAKVPRIGPHSSSDDQNKYRTIGCIASDQAKDILPRMENYLVGLGISIDEMQQMKNRCFEEVEYAAVEADQIPFPNADTAADHVFKKSITQDFQLQKTSKCPLDSIVMMDALNHALDEEMQYDSNTVVFGQDVAHGKGGVFGITRNLTEKFGASRCFNSPLAESSIIGVALGMSIAGIRPVVEIQFADYMWTGVNQLFNELSSFHYRSNAEWNCPVTIRMPYGGYIQGGPYHSQSTEAILAHIPGLKIVIPSNANNAKRLLKMAIRDPNPVVFLEHKALYRQRVFSASPEPSKEELQAFGVAKYIRKGTNLTVVCWGMMVFMASQVADRLLKEGISVEVIDLRTIVPLDLDLIVESIKKTGKLLIAHEAVRTCGFGAEIAALIAEEAFDLLDAPIKRVTAKDCPVPYCKQLEDAVLPQIEDLERAIRQLAQF